MRLNGIEKGGVMNSKNDAPSLVRLSWSNNEAQTLVVFDLETTELISQMNDVRSLVTVST